MMMEDVDAIICDLAETYHILVDDLETIPIMTLARLCAGLHADSRIKMRMMELTEVAPSFALVRIADELAILKHALVGAKGSPAPSLYMDVMTGKQKNEDTKGFETIEDFEAARQRMIHG